MWRQVFIRSYLERDIRQFGIRVFARTLERFWTMLAHGQGGVLNAQRLAYSLDANWPRALGRICDRGADRCGSKRNTTLFFFRTQASAEVDLVLEFTPDRRWAIEIKKSSAPTIWKGLRDRIRRPCRRAWDHRT